MEICLPLIFVSKDLYNPNGNNQPTQNIEEFNEDIAEGFFDDEIIEDSTQNETQDMKQKLEYTIHQAMATDELIREQ